MVKSIITFAALIKLIGLESIIFVELISETLIYPETINKINKYKSFISFDKNTYKQKLIQLCST